MLGMLTMRNIYVQGTCPLITGPSMLHVLAKHEAMTLLYNYPVYYSHFAIWCTMVTIQSGLPSSLSPPSGEAPEQRASCNFRTRKRTPKIDVPLIPCWRPDSHV